MDFRRARLGGREALACGHGRGKRDLSGPTFLAAAMSSTIGVGLLAAGAAADAGTTADPTPSPLTSVPQAGEGASQVQGILRASAVEAAPWPAENGLVRVGPSALQAIQLPGARVP